eukprot:g3391.t1
MPTSKKRCWTLVVKDIKNVNVKEAEVLSSFRRRYTSARNVAFRSPTNYGDEALFASIKVGGNDDDDDDDDSSSTTFPTVIEEGTLLIEILFTGPQPIEGPAGLLCTLLQSTFVAAYPVQLGRGRKRKVRAGVAAAVSALSSTPAPCSSGISGEADVTTTSGGSDGNRTFAGSRNFVFQRSRNVSNRSGVNDEGGYFEPTTSRPKYAAGCNTRSIDTSSEASSTCVFNTTSSKASNGVSNLDDLFKNLLEGGCGSSAPMVTAATCGEGHQWPSLNGLGEEVNTPVVAFNTTTSSFPRNLPPSNPGPAAGYGYCECKGDTMSREEAVSLFTAASSTTAAATTTADGGLVVSEDCLWEMPAEDGNTLCCVPPLERHPSSSWGRVHDAAAVVANDSTEDDGDDGARADGCESSPASNATSVEEIRRRQQQAQRQRQRQHQQRQSCSSDAEDNRVELPSLRHQISFGWCREECDFDGRSATFQSGDAEAQSSSTSSPLHGTSRHVGSRCYFMFQGLRRAVQGYGIRHLAVRARFSVDSGRANVVEKTAGQVEVDARGHAHASVTYPSMQEICPEVYAMSSVRIIEVDMVVEIRSRDGKFVFVGPTLKVTYRRPTSRVFVSTIPVSRRTALKEAEVLSSFRRRYTSARNVAFRSPTNYGDEALFASIKVGGNDDDDDDDDSSSTTFPTVIEEGTLLIEILFTGPQPIEGPAGLLCTLLQSTFVAAYPVQLGRGRKRKVRAGVAARGISGEADVTTGSGGSGGNRTVAGGSQFDFQRSRNVSNRSGVNNDGDYFTPKALRRNYAAGYNNRTSLIDTSSDTASEARSTCVFSSTSSTASTDISNLDDLFEDLLEGGCSSSGASTPAAATNGGGHQWPSLSGLGEEMNSPVVAYNTTGDAFSSLESLPASNPGPAAGYSYFECKKNAMSQEEALSLFVTPSSTTTAAAAGGFDVSEGDLWDMPTEDSDILFFAPPLERHPSTSWGGVHAAAAVATNDNAGDNGGYGARADGCESSLASSATSVEELRWRRRQQQRRSCFFSDVEDDRAKLPPLLRHQISFGWCEEECDFDGRSVTFPRRDAEARSSLQSSSTHETSRHAGRRCYFMFKGLQGALQGCDPRDVAVRARFSVDSGRAKVVEKMATRVEVDARGNGHASVTYPSMQEICPEVYAMSSIRVVEVDMVVEIRSRNRTFVYHIWPTLKVTYRRPETRVFVPTIPNMSRQTTERARRQRSSRPGSARARRNIRGAHTLLVSRGPGMSAMTYASSTMPNSKKRCWTLLVKDIKNMNVKEAEVLSSFRRRYTSARNLAFRSPINYGDEAFLAAIKSADNNENDNNSSTTFPSIIEEGTVVIEIQFTGPQPIEGPAGLLCTLLQSTFVAAYPIQLGRGRKRKVRAGVAAAVSALSSTSAPCSSGSRGGEANATTTTTSGGGGANGGGGGGGNRSFAGSSNFNFQRGRNISSRSVGNDDGDCFVPRASRPFGAAGQKNNSMGSSDTGSEASTACAFSSTSSTASSAISNLDDLFKNLLDGGSSSSSSSSGASTPAAAATSTLSRTRLPHHNRHRRQLSTGMTLSPAGPGQATAGHYHGRRKDEMSQAVWHFAAGSATTSAAAAAAAASEDSLEDMLMDDRDDLPPRPPAVSRHARVPSWPWAPRPVHAPAKLEDGDSGGGDDDAKRRASREPRAFPDATMAMLQRRRQQQQQQQRWHGQGEGEGRPLQHNPWYDGEGCNPAAGAAGAFEVSSAGRQIFFRRCQEECDFDGRSTTSPPSGHEAQSSPASSSRVETGKLVGSRCSFTLEGLQGAVPGHQLRDLAVRARFFVDAQGANVVDKVASPLEVDANGHAHATVTYPSILEVWPEVFIMDSIRVIEVAMFVEVRSRDGNHVYTGPTVKVIYRRPTRQVFTSSIPIARQNSQVSCGPLDSHQASSEQWHEESGPNRSCVGLLQDTGQTLGDIEFELCSELYAGTCTTAESVGCNVDNEELEELLACVFEDNFGCDDFMTCEDATAGLATEVPAAAPSAAPATPSPSTAAATPVPVAAAPAATGTPATATPAPAATTAPTAPTFPTPVFPLPSAAPTTDSRGGSFSPTPTAAPTADASPPLSSTAFPSPAVFEGTTVDTMAPSGSSIAPTGVEGLRGGIGNAFSGAPTAAPSGFEAVDDVVDGTNGGTPAIIRHAAGNAAWSIAFATALASLTSALAALAS